MYFRCTHHVNIEAHSLPNPWWFFAVFKKIHYSLFNIAMLIGNHTAFNAILRFNRALGSLACHATCLIKYLILYFT